MWDVSASLGLSVVLLIWFIFLAHHIVHLDWKEGRTVWLSLSAPLMLLKIKTKERHSIHTKFLK